jgi:hypothetical protein
MNNDKFYFEENRGKYTLDMLDKNIDNNPKYMILRDWIEQFINDGYFDVLESKDQLDKLTNNELCHVIDWIDYLESK